MPHAAQGLSLQPVPTPVISVPSVSEPRLHARALRAGLLFSPLQVQTSSRWSPDLIPVSFFPAPQPLLPCFLALRVRFWGLPQSRSCPFPDSAPMEPAWCSLGPGGL